MTIESKIKSLRIEKRAFIGGSYVDSKSSKTLSKSSSADGRDLSGLADCNEEDVNLAVSAAKEAYNSRSWADKDPAEKKEILLKLASLMNANREELALLDTLETGRAYKDYFFDSIPKAIEVVNWFAECADKHMDISIPPRKNATATITKVPLGVVGCITPWNDPLVPAMWKMAPALVMGNSVVMKPAEQSSFSLLRLAALAKEAGLPDGVLNILPGRGEIAGKALALHHDVAGIFFTGSTEVGKLILEYSGKSNMKKVGLECGGKSAFIVSKNCDQLQVAAETLAQNIFYNQGQICSAPSRAFVHESVMDKFLGFLYEATAKYAPENPFEPETRVGCMVSREQKERVENFVNEGKKSGVSFYEQKRSSNYPAKGQFIDPIIFVDIKTSSSLFQEEIFGPVLCVSRFNDLDEVVRVANNSRYGLAASIWTNDVDEAYQVSRALEAGIVHVNSYGEDDITVPFGGFKQSGIGKDKSLLALNEYSELKTIWFKSKPILR